MLEQQISLYELPWLLRVSYKEEKTRRKDDDDDDFLLQKAFLAGSLMRAESYIM